MEHTATHAPTSAPHRGASRRSTRRLQAAAAGALLALGIAACGSDAPAAAKETPASAAAVKTFCSTTDTLIKQLGTTLSNPSDAATSAFNAAVKALNTTAAGVVKTSPAAATGISACLKKVLVAMSAAGVAPSVPDVTVKGGSTTTVKGGGAGAAGFCKDVDALVTKLAAAAKDPTKANTGALTAEAQALTSKAAALLAGDPSAAATVQACMAKIGPALTGLGGGGGGGAVTTVYTPPATDGSATTAAADTTAAGGGSTDAGIAAFCAKVDDLVVKYKAALTDPSKAGDLAALAAELPALANEGSSIITANPANAPAVSACLQKLSTIGS